MNPDQEDIICPSCGHENHVDMPYEHMTFDCDHCKESIYLEKITTVKIQLLRDVE